MKRDDFDALYDAPTTRPKAGTGLHLMGGRESASTAVLPERGGRSLRRTVVGNDVLHQAAVKAAFVVSEEGTHIFFSHVASHVVILVVWNVVRAHAKVIRGLRPQLSPRLLAPPRHKVAAIPLAEQLVEV